MKCMIARECGAVVHGHVSLQRRDAALSVTKRRIALVLALTAWIVTTAAHMAAQQGPPAPSAAAVADSEAVAGAHRSRTLAALFEEFRTTTPDNARINSRAISNLFSDGNPLMRLVSSGDFSPIQ